LVVSKELLEDVVQTLDVSPRCFVHLGVNLATAELDNRDRIERGVELSVSEIFDQATLGPCSRVDRIESRRGVSIFEVLADDRGVVQRSLIVNEGGHLSTRVHV